MTISRLYFFVTLEADFPSSGFAAGEISTALSLIRSKLPEGKMKIEYPVDEINAVQRKKGTFVKADLLIVPSKAPAQIPEAIS